jgi:N-acylneuraminate cytidylyltransferase
VTYLRQGLELLSNSNQLFSFSVTSFPFPVQRAIKINNDKISMFYPEYTLSRSQDLDEAYHDAGQFYWGRPQAFLDEVDMFSEDSIPVVLPRYLVQDIDTLEDWKRAELMYKTISYRD